MPRGAQPSLSFNEWKVGQRKENLLCIQRERRHFCSMKSKTNSSDWFVIIMAGGRGERFWPVSRVKTPKQLITLIGGRSFLQQAVDRVLPVAPLKNIFVITNA